MAERKPSDEELLRAMREGDEAAFVALYRRWQAAVYRFALQMSGSRAAAEDVTQEAFLALIRDSSGYRESRGSLGAYLYGIARHLVLRTLEREKVAPMLDEAELEKLADSGQGADDPHQQLLRAQRAGRLWTALLALPVHYREVIVLCELHEMDYAEAAAALGCRIGTVRSRLHRGRALLAERLRPVALEAGRAVAIKTDGCAV